MTADARAPGVPVASLDELERRERIVVSIDGTEVGLYWYAGEVRAWRNVCPHAGGPVCQGKMMPRTLQGVREDRTSDGPRFSDSQRNIVCPWHGYEFDVLTGVHPASAGTRLAAVPVQVVDGMVEVVL